MGCNGIPEYLLKGEKPVIDMAQDAEPSDLIYRIKFKGNPIEIPGGMLTEVSCKWSKLIETEHLPLYFAENLGDSVGFSTISEIKDFKVTDSNPNEDNAFHKLTCIVIHMPEECDYSHVVVNINHEIFTSANEETRTFQEHITYKMWKDRKATLKKRDGHFYKELRKQYRADFIAALFQEELNFWA